MSVIAERGLACQHSTTHRKETANRSTARLQCCGTSFARRVLSRKPRDLAALEKNDDSNSSEVDGVEKLPGRMRIRGKRICTRSTYRSRYVSTCIRSTERGLSNELISKSVGVSRASNSGAVIRGFFAIIPRHSICHLPTRDRGLFRVSCSSVGAQPY